MAYDYVPYGINSPYEGWFRQEILDELKKVDTAIKGTAAGSGQVQSATMNGKSVSFFQDENGTSSLSTLRSQKSDLITALSFVDDTVNTTTDRTIANFTGWPIYVTVDGCPC